MKRLEELIDMKDSAWPLILEAKQSAANSIEILPPDPATRGEVLLALQMTTWSTAGAVVYETGGILVDHGWLRVLGSGHPTFNRTVPQWTTEMTEASIEEWPYFLVADDVIGGFFAVDCGALGEAGKVFYYAPDTFRWENMGINYDKFLRGFCMNNNLDDYYSPYRWDGWQAEIAEMSADQAFSIVPPLCIKPAERASRNNGVWGGRSRSAVPISAVFCVSMDIGRQLDDLPNGATVVLKVKE